MICGLPSLAGRSWLPTTNTWRARLREAAVAWVRAQRTSHASRALFTRISEMPTADLTLRFTIGVQ